MTQLKFSPPNEHRGHSQVMVVSRTPMRVRLALGGLLLFIGYIAFCVANLSPYSKQEFINSFLSPIFRLLGA